MSVGSGAGLGSPWRRVPNEVASRPEEAGRKGLIIKKYQYCYGFIFDYITNLG